MDSRVLTHLSVEDLNVYLLGKPEPAQRATIEEHYLRCSECLEQICALAARIDKWQLGQHFVPVPIAPTPEGTLTLSNNVIVMRRPLLTPSQSWALKAVAAAVILLVAPSPTRMVRFDHLMESPLSVTAMNLPFTRELPYATALLGEPQVEFIPAPSQEARVVRTKAYRQFHAPEGRPVQFVEAAFIEAPNLNFGDTSIGPMPVELDSVPPAVYHSKPNLFKRFLMAVASPFRSPRS